MNGRKLRVAIVGWGKIAQDQHAPTLAADPAMELAAVVSRRGAGPAGIPVFTSLAALRGRGPPVDAVSLCGTPRDRMAAALEAIDAGWAVMLEKPPAAGLSAARVVRQAAERAGVTLFATWHARESAGVARARALLAGRPIDGLRIDWREDVRRWHPDQAWVWEPGGFGVFDPGINGLSVATAILPVELALDAAVLDIPANRATPIAAALRFTGPGVPADARVEFDWRGTPGECWQVSVRSGGDALLLTDGGARLSWNGRPEPVEATREYTSLYRRFAALTHAGRSDVDLRPLQLVADAFLIGKRRVVEAFDD